MNPIDDVLVLGVLRATDLRFPRISTVTITVFRLETMIPTISSIMSTTPITKTICPCPLTVPSDHISDGLKESFEYSYFYIILGFGNPDLLKRLFMRRPWQAR